MAQYEHNPGDHEDPAAAQTWTVAGVGAVVFIATVLFVAAATYLVLTGERETKVIDVAPVQLEEILGEQQRRLTGAPHKEIRVENGGDVESLVIPVDDVIGLYVAEASQAQKEAQP